MIALVCRTCGAPVLEAVHVATALRDAIGPRSVGAVSSERPIERIVIGYRALIDVVDNAAAQLRGFCSGACERAPQAPESEATQAARCFREATRRMTPVPGRER